MARGSRMALNAIAAQVCLRSAILISMALAAWPQAPACSQVDQTSGIHKALGALGANWSHRHHSRPQLPQGHRHTHCPRQRPRHGSWHSPGLDDIMTPGDSPGHPNPPGPRGDRTLGHQHSHRLQPRYLAIFMASRSNMGRGHQQRPWRWQDHGLMWSWAAARARLPP